MQLSAEVRWWWRGSVPAAVSARFAAHGEERIDVYLLEPQQCELGVKRRGAPGGDAQRTSGVELKGLVATRSRTSGVLDGRAELWCKWASTLPLTERLPTVQLQKRRQLRKFDTGGADGGVVELRVDARPANGCNVELTRVTLREDAADPQWWTLGFEAFGGIDVVEDSLHRTMRHLDPEWHDARDALRGGRCFSYPAWLQHVQG